MDEWIRGLFGAASGALAGTWGMLIMTSGRIRALETNRVSLTQCDTRHAEILHTQELMWNDIKEISNALARIEGHLGIQR